MGSDKKGNRLTFQKAFIRWAKHKELGTLEDLLAEGTPSVWSAAIQKIMELDFSKGVNLYEKHAMKPGFRQRVIGDICQTSDTNKAIWRKALQSENPVIFWDACYMLSHIGNKGDQALLSRISIKNNSKIPDARPYGIKALVTLTKKDVSKNRATTSRKAPPRPSRALLTNKRLVNQFKLLSDKTQSTTARVNALRILAEDSGAIANRVPVQPLIEGFLLIEKSSDRKLRLSVLDMIENCSSKADVKALMALHSPTLSDDELWRVYRMLRQRSVEFANRTLATKALEQKNHENFIMKNSYQLQFSDKELAVLTKSKNPAILEHIHRMIRTKWNQNHSSTHLQLKKILKNPAVFYGRKLDAKTRQHLAYAYTLSHAGNLNSDDEKMGMRRFYFTDQFPPSYETGIKELQKKGVWPSDIPSPLTHFERFTTYGVLGSGMADSRSNGTYLLTYALLAGPNQLSQFRKILSLEELGPRVRVECMCALLRLRPSLIKAEVSKLTPREQTYLYTHLCRTVRHYSKFFKLESITTLAAASNRYGDLVLVIDTLAHMGGSRAEDAVKRIYQSKASLVEPKYRSLFKKKVQSAVKKSRQKTTSS